MSEPHTPELVRMSLPSRLELLVVLDRVSTALCERMEFGDDDSAQITMSVIEAGTNAIQHGHRRDASKSFDIEFALWPDRMVVTVHDTGPGFDLQEVAGDITTPDRLFEPRGRGIFIMRACMDSVDFRFDASGTTCTLVKHRRSAAAANG